MKNKKLGFLTSGIVAVVAVTLSVMLNYNKKTEACFFKCNIKKASIVLDKTEYAATGSEITPEVKVVYKSKELVKNIDYKVTYESNINPGTGTVLVKGIKKYGGKKKLTFTIVEKEENQNQENQNQEQIPYSKVEFSDTQLFAIADASSGNSSDIISKYLTDASDISDVNIGEGQTFVVIPKDENIRFDIYRVELGEDGSLVTGENILKNKNGALLIKSDYMEYIPNFRIVATDGTSTVSYEVTFSGIDGSIYNPYNNLIKVVE